MNPNVIYPSSGPNSEPSTGQVAPPAPPPPPGSPRSKWVKRVLLSIFWLLNTAAGLLFAFVILFAISASSSPVGILLIALIPMVSLALLVAAVYDVVFCINYLRSRPASKTKRNLAAGGLVLAVAAVIFVGYVYYDNVTALRELRAENSQNAANEYSEYMKAAEASGQGFDILTARELPEGYVWDYGRVFQDGEAESIYSDVR